MRLSPLVMQAYSDEWINIWTREMLYVGSSILMPSLAQQRYGITIAQLISIFCLSLQAG